MTRIEYAKILTVSKPRKSLTKGFKRGTGRNNEGMITMRHKGGGVKRRWRDIDFSYNKRNIPAKIETVEYDPNRTAFIGIALYQDGERRYVVLPKSMKAGDEFIVSADAKVRIGNRLQLAQIPVGTFVYNVEVKPEGGSKLARSAGSYIEVIAQDGAYTHLKMPSTEVRRVLGMCWATIGEPSNEENRLVNLGKAGRSRKLGIRPTVRGSAMNPVDHPHGGGEGRQGRGHRRARSLWGKPTGKGQKTRTPKKYSNKFIVSRRKVGGKRSK